MFLLGVMGLNYQITKIQRPSDEPETATNNGDVDVTENSEEKKGMLDKSESKMSRAGPPEGIEPRERKMIGSFDEDENYDISNEDVEKIHRLYNLWVRQ